MLLMNKFIAESSLGNDSRGDKELAEATALAVAPGEIVLGTVSAINAQGNPTVSFPQNTTGQPLVAVTTVAISHQHLGRQVALLFARGDLRSPIIIGLIHSPLFDLLENYAMLQPVAGVAPDDDLGDIDPFMGNQIVKPEAENLTQAVRIDGKRVVIEGKEEIVLSCGESSITLTKAGKILIRGKYLLSRSSGVNRILGGSVQVN